MPFYVRRGIIWNWRGVSNTHTRAHLRSDFKAAEIGIRLSVAVSFSYINRSLYWVTRRVALL